jgi:[ribosomal protein S18]-alanine N-acetyltransferase
MTVSIRFAVGTDVPVLLAIEQQAPIAAHWSSDEYSKLVSGGVVFVAEAAGHPCGFICGKKIGGEWEIENVVISTGWLRQGIASQLIEELIDRAQSDGASSVFLEVRESNAAAHSLYLKHGFREVGRRRAYYRDPIEDAILYTRKLAE